jgi:hypothetical protein
LIEKHIVFKKIEARVIRIDIRKINFNRGPFPDEAVQEAPYQPLVFEDLIAGMAEMNDALGQWGRRGRDASSRRAKGRDLYWQLQR